MGGGGGGGGSSTTVQSVPAELSPLATAYTQKAIGLSNQAYNPYTGQRYADLTPMQNTGLNMIQNRATQGSGTMANAEGNLNQLMSSGPNPYLDQMVSNAQKNVLSNANQAQARSGSFGNSGIAEEAVRQMGTIASNMYGNAYAQDQSNRLQAIGMAPTFGNQAYQDAAQVLNAGQLMQDQAQKGLDFGYQGYQEAENLPYKQLAAMGGVFGSNLGMTSQTTSSQDSGGK